ncbi:MAG: L-aspartate oxidase [Rickettsiales bacterium]|nr:L-aspartate oxidase [Rickettsiales bacterium]
MKTDFLVIGSGIAGLWYALRMAEHGRVTVITKKNKAESNTNYAQGGIAAVMSPLDSFESHVQDTLSAGAGICDAEVVNQVVREGPDCIRELIEMGARFSSQDGEMHLGREGGHSAHRIIHHADMTGREIERVLLKQMAASENITLLEHHYCVDLLVEDGRCNGALVLDTKADELFNLTAVTTLLASGGSGRLFQHTTNPAVATGDGAAMAWRAGARLANMEFVQFHPTSLYHEGKSVFLISEAVRGAGAFLINKDGERFMQGYHPLGDLAPRDIVARGIDEQLKSRGDECVYLDATYLAKTEIKSHFPTIAKMCLKYGIDMMQEPIPVVPAAHYQCGGVMTGQEARTSVTALLACGEVTYTGLHGANRLASNSLLEALVFSTHAVDASLEEFNRAAKPVEPAAVIRARREKVDAKQVEALRQALRALMWKQVGIVRRVEVLEGTAKQLADLSAKVEGLVQAHACEVALCELQNLVQVAVMVVDSALMRKESRGLHSVKDYPELSTAFEVPTIIQS